MHRLFAAVLLIVAPVLAQPEAPRQSPAPLPAQDLKFTPPPGPATEEDKSLLARAKEFLESKKVDPSVILIDPAFMPIHPRTEFRALVAAHATTKPLTMAGPKEPGTRLTVTFEFVDEAGKPVEDGLLYVYHTSAKGWYSDKAAHIQSNAGDDGHARLFGYARTDAHGRVTLHTIRPASYPNTDLPQHIHLHLSIGGLEALVSEVIFEDDPKLTREAREQGVRNGFVPSKVDKAEDGSQKCKAVFKVPRR